MKQREVAITGVGAISPFGLTAADMWEGICQGKCGISTITHFDPIKFPCKIAGQVPPYSMKEYLPKHHRKAGKLMSRDIELAVIAADDAFRNSGLGTKHIETQPQITPERTSISIGAGLVSCEIEEMAPAVAHSVTGGKFDIKKWGAEGINLVTPLWLLKYLPNMLACHIGIIHDIQGPGNNITSGECAGPLSIAESVTTIKRDASDVALAGSGEAKVDPIVLLRQIILGRTTTTHNDSPQEACRPFACDADGAAFSEGAGMVVLEELEHAKARGAYIYATIAGIGESTNLCEQLERLEENAPGLQIAIKKALAQAAITPDQIDLIIPHGTAVACDDKAEAAAIAAVFGDCISKIPVLPTKSMLGHTGTAGGAIDVVIAAKAMQTGTIPAAKNCPKVFEGCKLNIVQTKIEKEIKYALCCSYTFGGQCVAIVLRKGGMQ